jgi:hypothetical protein
MTDTQRKVRIRFLEDEIRSYGFRKADLQRVIAGMEYDLSATELHIEACEKNLEKMKNESRKTAKRNKRT